MMNFGARQEFLASAEAQDLEVRKHAQNADLIPGGVWQPLGGIGRRRKPMPPKA